MALTFWRKTRMPVEEILHTSEDMMRGQKWRAFLLDVSFLGWRVLTILTFGVLGNHFLQEHT